jgi:hypothetical protein
MNSSAWSLPNGSGSAGGCRRPLAGRAAITLAAVVTAIGALCLGAAPAVADDCPNAALRIQSNSSHLPDCRAYEQVTSPFKEGFAPGEPVYTNDGSAFAYRSPGQFSGNGMGGNFNQYVAMRSAAGWQTTAPSPDTSQWATNTGQAVPGALSDDLRSSVWAMARRDQSREVADFYRRAPDGTFTRIGPVLNPETLPPGSPGGVPEATIDNVAASADLSHVIFQILLENVFPGIAPGNRRNLYEHVGAGNDRPRYVGLDNEGNQIAPNCDTEAGGDISGYRSMSVDGRVIFWTGICPSHSPLPASELWARINGTTSIHASASQCTRASSDPGGACNGPSDAVFQGADADGSRVYFTTTQQLVNGDTDDTNDLYACDIPSGTPAPVGVSNPCAALSQVSGAATDASVQGVVRVSDDGSRVYFVARGVLAANHGANDTAAVAGDDNLYVWRKDTAHPAGQPTFVGKLDPAENGLWGEESGGGHRPAQTTDDGRYLVLSTISPLVNDGPDADTDSAADVYRYDAETRALVRLSASTSGQDSNTAGLDATFYAVGYPVGKEADRARTVMSDDAEKVVFRTSEALSPSDTNGIVDIYAWQNGQVSLISSGGPTLDDQVFTQPMIGLITASGQDIYFTTTAQLTPSDRDTQVDFYDARVGGGFDYTRPAPCAGDVCHGAPGVAPDAPAPASDGTAPAQATPTFSLHKVSAQAVKKLASTGRITLKVTANTPSTLSAKATAIIERKTVGVGAARRTLSAPGTASLALTLSKAARARLAAQGKLTVKVVVSNSKVLATRSTTLKLAHAKAKPSEKTSKRPTTEKSVKRAVTSSDGGRS